MVGKCHGALEVVMRMASSNASSPPSTIPCQNGVSSEGCKVRKPIGHDTEIALADWRKREC